jgi:hypothetical protein
MADSGVVKSPGKAAARAEVATCRADRDRPSFETYTCAIVIDR